MAINNIYFIDFRVADYQALIGNLSADSKWFVLKAEQDGIAQMQEALANYSDLDTIQIISHGSQGTLYLGNTVLSNESIGSYSSQLGSIGTSLSGAGDILLYGCNIGQSDLGLQFVNTFAQLTGADVAASNDVTGASALGGDWQLEVALGSIEATALSPQSYQGLLNYDVGLDIALAQDGSIVVSGYSVGAGGNVSTDFLVSKFTADGIPVASFGNNDGAAITDISGDQDVAVDAIIQADGKIVVAGYANIKSEKYSWGQSDFALARYNLDGSLDGTFGSGNGIITTDITGNQDSVMSILAQPDGRLLAVGYAYVDGDTEYDFALARYNQDGSLDTTFGGGDGFLTTAISAYQDSPSGACLLADGKIIVAGLTSNPLTTGFDFVLVKYNADGSLDTSFSGDGVVTTDISGNPSQPSQESWPYIAIQSDEKILLAGTASGASGAERVLVRYNVDGSLDDGFGVGGIVKFGNLSGYSSGVATQSDGEIIVSSTASNSIIELFRFNTDGSIDNSFGTNGVATLDFAYGCQASSINVQDDGKILLTGNFFDAASNSILLLSRFTQDGVLDSTFCYGTPENNEVVGTSVNDTVNGGGGNDTINTGYGDDIVVGGDGNDIVNTGGGNDLIVGGNGAGDDTYIGGSGDDTVRYTSAVTGIIVNLTTGTASGNEIGNDILAEIENIIGGKAGDVITGNASNNKLNGYTGADTMIGGDGSDTYYVDNVGDVVTETNATASTGGTDMVYSQLSAYTLTANIERGYIFTGAVASLTGNGLSNVLYAGSGSNVLNGGAGADTVSFAYATAGVTASLTKGLATGGSGNDTFISIENLNGSGYNDILTGSSAANTLSGGAGNDTLNGAAGADTMMGGDGSDTYYVDNAGDVVTETNAIASTGGEDMVYSQLSAYTLTANVEKGYIYTGAAANLTGNGLNNVLYAGAGNNVLHGGDGFDTVSYAFATAGITADLGVSTAQATGGSGSDTLISINHLNGSNFNDVLRGSSSDNTLSGGAGNDMINGGLGNDSLYGGTGLDTFRFSLALGPTNVDRINDFVTADDTIQLENAIFAKLTATGTLAAGSFVSASGAVALDANDYILYDTATHNLYYDADGNGAGAAIKFATLVGVTGTVTNADFLVT